MRSGTSCGSRGRSLLEDMWPSEKHTSDKDEKDMPSAKYEKRRRVSPTVPGLSFSSEANALALPEPSLLKGSDPRPSRLVQTSILNHWTTTEARRVKVLRCKAFRC